MAHPDDETTFAATLYKTATHLDGACDLVVITNGEGGFKYSTLSEPIYGLELTDEQVGREHLPAIRKRELLAGCAILQVREVVFLNQRDHRYTQDPHEVLDPAAGVWDLPEVRARLAGLLARGGYDFVFTLAPEPETHGHHKAATILALEAVAGLPVGERPVVLCATVTGGDEPAPTFAGLAEFPITSIRTDVAPLVFVRTTPFGYRGRLDYRIIVNWVIAAHKSQGTMQLAAGRGERELFYFFSLNGDDALPRARALFTRLAEPQYPAKTYGPSAGTNTGPEPALGGAR